MSAAHCTRAPSCQTRLPAHPRDFTTSRLNWCSVAYSFSNRRVITRDSTHTSFTAIHHYSRGKESSPAPENATREPAFDSAAVGSVCPGHHLPSHALAASPPLSFAFLTPAESIPLPACRTTPQPSRPARRSRVRHSYLVRCPFSTHPASPTANTDPGRALRAVSRVKKIIAQDPDTHMCSNNAAFVITLATVSASLSAGFVQYHITIQ